MGTTFAVQRLAIAALFITASACDDTFSPPPVREGVATMTLIPRSATIQAGHVVSLKAEVFDEFGDRMQNVSFTWTSSDESVATVSVTGTVQGQREGRAAITATGAGRSQSSAVSVVGKREPKSEPIGEPVP
jgi:hypothetical protein